MANGNEEGLATTGAGKEARNVAGAITSMGIDELISNLAIGIAKGQMALDQASMEIAMFMSEAQVAFGKRAGSDEPDLVSLIELGFTPNFYQFVDTILEVRVAISTKFEETREYETSDTQMHTDETEEQSQYEKQRSSSYSGGGYSAGWGYGGYGYGGWGYGARSYGYSGSNSTQESGSTSVKKKNITATTVDAKYASTYNYAVEASSTIKTKIVPVPPPTVFEEIVRAKVQERRDLEERLRLRGQVLLILPNVIGMAHANKEKIDKLSPGHTSDRENAVAEIRANVETRRDEYAKLTNPHWAIIRSVEDREAADNALRDALALTEEILAGYVAYKDTGIDDPDDVAFKKLIEDLGAKMQAFDAKLTEIQERMTPPDQA